MSKLTICFTTFWALLALLGKAHAQFDLYYDTGVGIRRLDLDMPASNQQIVSPSLVNTSTGISLDYVGRKLYWIADTQFGSIDKIRRSNLDGTGVEQFLLPLGQPSDLVIDPYARKLYWPERITNTINVINLDGTGAQSIIATTEPRGMDIDFAHNQLYWVELESNRLRRANLDGTQIVDVITAGMNRPFDVTIDPLNGQLYWVELGANTDNEHGNVWMANLDGTNKRLIAADQIQPQDLVVDYARQSIYWGNESGNSLMRADLDGSNVSGLPVAHTSPYLNFVLDAPPAIPEPSTYALVVTGSAILGWSWKRRNKAAKI